MSSGSGVGLAVGFGWGLRCRAGPRGDRGLGRRVLRRGDDELAERRRVLVAHEREHRHVLVQRRLDEVPPPVHRLEREVVVGQLDNLEPLRRRRRLGVARERPCGGIFGGDGAGRVGVHGDGAADLGREHEVRRRSELHLDEADGVDQQGPPVRLGLRAGAHDEVRVTDGEVREAALGRVARTDLELLLLRPIAEELLDDGDPQRPLPLPPLVLLAASARLLVNEGGRPRSDGARALRLVLRRRRPRRLAAEARRAVGGRRLVASVVGGRRERAAAGGASSFVGFGSRGTVVWFRPAAFRVGGWRLAFADVRVGVVGGGRLVFVALVRDGAAGRGFVGVARVRGIPRLRLVAVCAFVGGRWCRVIVRGRGGVRAAGKGRRRARRLRTVYAVPLLRCFVP
mmetsp:Transcript_25036/g.77367  ORF Transcript_25036/g.77367 Transcript_25036/m.77367 type:complete len:399 (-) Transcript_25036:1088-2284(-)